MTRCSCKANKLRSIDIFSWTSIGHFNVDFRIYTHGNKLGNTCHNVTTNFGLRISFFVKIMKNVLTTEFVVSKVAAMRKWLASNKTAAESGHL